MKSKVGNAFVWKLSERLISQGINLIVQIILARILSPNEFGTLAVILIFVNVANILAQSGISTIIVQKKELDGSDVSSAFIIGVGSAAACYLIIFFLSPLIETFYGIDNLSWMLRAISISILFSAPIAILTGLLMRRMEFKKVFFRSLISVPISGAIGIFMALKGFGVWALIVQNISNGFITCTVLFVTTRLIILKKPTKQSFKAVFGFSWKVIVSNLLISSYENVRSFVIGKMYSVSDLAYYDKGQTYTDYLTQAISTSLQSVILPVFSRNQTNIASLKSFARKSVKYGTYILFPVLFGFAAVSFPAVKLLLTDRWAGCIPFIIIFCIYRLPYPVFTTNQQVYYAVGRSDIVLKLEIIRCVLNFGVFFSTLNYGPLAIAIGMASVSIASTLMFFFVSRKLINYTIREQLADILPAFILSGVMFLSVFFFKYLSLHNALILIIQLVVGVAVYLLLSIFTKNDCFLYIKRVVFQKNRKSEE